MAAAAGSDTQRGTLQSYASAIKQIVEILKLSPEAREHRAREIFTHGRYGITPEESQNVSSSYLGISSEAQLKTDIRRYLMRIERELSSGGQISHTATMDDLITNKTFIHLFDKETYSYLHTHFMRDRQPPSIAPPTAPTSLRISIPWESASTASTIPYSPASSYFEFELNGGRKTKKRKRAKKNKTRKAYKTHRGLKSFWQKLANGKMIVLVLKNGRTKKVTKNIKKIWKACEDDKNVKAVLTSSMSWDAFERLEKRAKGASATEVLKKYPKYFKKIKVMTSKDRSL